MLLLPAKADDVRRNATSLFGMIWNGFREATDSVSREYGLQIARSRAPAVY